MYICLNIHTIICILTWRMFWLLSVLAQLWRWIKIYKVSMFFVRFISLHVLASLIQVRHMRSVSGVCCIVFFMHYIFLDILFSLCYTMLSCSTTHLVYVCWICYMQSQALQIHTREKWKRNIFNRHTSNTWLMHAITELNKNLERYSTSKGKAEQTL
jgi:hypothetical protein